MLYLGEYIQMTMKESLTILPLWVCVLTFCGRQGVIDESLDLAESCLTERPDSALSILEAMDSTRFDSKSQNARYALLKSIALDKSYIDRSDDSLVNIAVNYYRHRHNSAYKFKSYYYQARIYQNAGEMDKAMESLVRAENIRSKSIQAADVARLHFAKAQICLSRYDLNGQLKELRDAANYSKICENGNNYIFATLSQANTYLILDDYERTDSCLSIIEQHQNLSYLNRLNKTGIQLLHSYKTDSSKEELEENCLDYISSAKDKSDLDWKLIAQVYNKTGKTELAKEALDRYAQDNNGSLGDYYFYLLATIQQAQGEYAEAYRNMAIYSHLSDSLNLVRINQEVKSAQKSYEASIVIIKQRVSFGIIASILALVVALCIRYHLRVKEKEKRLRQHIEEIKEEYEELSVIKDKFKPVENIVSDLDCHDSSGRDALIQNIIEARIKSLVAFLNKDIPDSLSRSGGSLDELLNNREQVTGNIGLIYAIYYPHFVAALAECDLSASEIGYCCLLVMGLKTSELPKVINYSNAYNISSRLRTKLGLTADDGTLSAWLKKVFAEKH